MGEVRTEIANAIETLGLTTKDIVALDNDSGGQLYLRLLEYFVKSGDRRWWWEDFRQEPFLFNDSDNDRPFVLLNEIIPESKENVWLMVEDDQEKYYPIYDTKPEIIKDIIGECFRFEYYIISKDMEWLVCENHHNSLIGIGETLRARNLEKIAN